MKMFVIKAMDVLTFVVAAIAIIIGFASREPLGIALGFLAAIVWSSMWCVLSSIACDLRTIKDSK